MLKYKYWATNTVILYYDIIIGWQHEQTNVNNVVVFAREGMFYPKKEPKGY